MTVKSFGPQRQEDGKFGCRDDLPFRHSLSEIDGCHVGDYPAILDLLQVGVSHTRFAGRVDPGFFRRDLTLLTKYGIISKF